VEQVQTPRAAPRSRPGRLEEWANGPPCRSRIALIRRWAALSWAFSWICPQVSDRISTIGPGISYIIINRPGRPNWCRSESLMQVFIFDEFGPETSAMLQALYSRSAESVLKHVNKVREKGPDQFMASYYVGYGHASIGDCGVTTLYIEDVSLLACKAIQDNPLYSGQETSTRYIDFSKQRVCDPIGSTRSEALQRRWIEFYSDVLPKVVEHLKSRFPLTRGANEKLWAKAIAARGFDVLRGFLPAGIVSQVAWTTNLRQAHEHLLRLEAHPLIEVRRIAEECRKKLMAQYPSSFGHKVTEVEREYLRRVAAREAYVGPEAIPVQPGRFEVLAEIDNRQLEAEVLDIIRTRPRKMQLPKGLGRYGHYRCRFILDFGSFRDLQRHRGGLCRMSLLTSDLGFHPWYLDQLPTGIRAKSERFLDGQLIELDEIGKAWLPREDRQYYLPIGMNVACELTYDLPEMVYVAELRSGQTVHPTLRWLAHQMALALRERHPQLALHADMSDSELCIRRGSQDIFEQSPAA
jgi:thymidylate synthase ThyX